MRNIFIRVKNHGFAYKAKDFYIHKGSIIKENNRYYFVDTASTSHCFVFEDIRVYKNNDFSFFTSNYDGIEKRMLYIG